MILHYQLGCYMIDGPVYLSPRKSRPSYSRIASSASYTSALPHEQAEEAHESSLELDETKVTPKSDILDLEALEMLTVSDRSLLFVLLTSVTSDSLTSDGQLISSRKP
jgi:hypothetical protein